MLRFSLFILLLLLLQPGSNAQVLNNYSYIQTLPGTYIYVNGSTFNAPSSTINLSATTGSNAQISTHHFTNNGTGSGDGVYNISGNWINNSVFISGQSSVFLNGSNQNLGGLVPTHFNNLSLTGTGTKQQSNHQFVSNILNINDIELSTNTFLMTVTNTDPNAIQRTTGFVSSLDTGMLVRKTADTLSYLFPVGSSIGVTRYRPVELAPTNSDTNFYAVRMANTDATQEGYDRSLISSNICNTNPGFYHRFDRLSGITPVNFTIFYNAATDGIWDGIAHWDGNPGFEIILGSSSLSSTPFNMAYADNWDDFSELPYILYNKNININLGNDTVLCGVSSFPLNAGTGFDTYVWSTGDITPIITVTTSGWVYVTVTKGICSITDSIQIILNPFPTPDLGNDTTVCDGDTLLLDAGLGYALYTWNTGDTTQTITVAAPGTWSVTVTDIYGCSGMGSINISAISYDATITNPGDICHDAPPLLLTAASTGGLWSGRGIIDPVAGLFDPLVAGIGEHVILYLISLQCGDSAFTELHVINCDPQEPHAVVPDIFSPNGDGENDFLFVRGEGIESLNFSVYSRWGEMLFNTADKNKSWDGTYRGKPVDPGVFVYHLVAKLIDGKEINIKGDITLVR